MATEGGSDSGASPPPANSSFTLTVPAEPYVPPQFPKQVMEEYMYDTEKIIDENHAKTFAAGEAMQKELDDGYKYMQAMAGINQTNKDQLAAFFKKPMETPEAKTTTPAPPSSAKTIPSSSAPSTESTSSARTLGKEPPYLSNPRDVTVVPISIPPEVYNYIPKTEPVKPPAYVPKPNKQEEEKGWTLFQHSSATKIKIVFIIIIIILALSLLLVLGWLFKTYVIRS